MTSIKIAADTRTATGKSPARRTRNAGKVPAVMYGPGDKGQAIAVNAADVKAILDSFTESMRAEATQRLAAANPKTSR